MKTSITKTILTLGFLAVLAGGATTSASAETRWDATHPRRVEVNERAKRIDRRIHQERREGELSRGQAHELRVENRGIRAQEHFDASRHGSHITRAEKRTLNREENGLSRQVGK